jgi:hypothetical protein
MRNTPNFVSVIGAFRDAERASANTRRVSVGAMMPSSQSRAVAIRITFGFKLIAQWLLELLLLDVGPFSAAA